MEAPCLSPRLIGIDSVFSCSIIIVVVFLYIDYKSSAYL